VNEGNEIIGRKVNAISNVFRSGKVKNHIETIARLGPRAFDQIDWLVSQIPARIELKTIPVVEQPNPVQVIQAVSSVECARHNVAHR